jgi:hypothetical protein
MGGKQRVMDKGSQAEGSNAQGAGRGDGVWGVRAVGHGRETRDENREARVVGERNEAFYSMIQ